MGDISALLKEMKRNLDACAMRPQQLAEMCQLIDGGTISGKIAKGLLPELLEKGGSPKELVESKGLVQVRTPEELRVTSRSDDFSPFCRPRSRTRAS